MDREQSFNAAKSYLHFPKSFSLIIYKKYMDRKEPEMNASSTLASALIICIFLFYPKTKTLNPKTLGSQS